jgi:uncharacterized protein YecE (DUF72 family)
MELPRQPSTKRPERGAVPDNREVRIGVVGWSIRKEQAVVFPSEGTHLERYAGAFACVEINTSFYRPHRVATYQRWAASVPDRFRFAVKMHREITHDRQLVDVREPLDRFLSEIAGLGAKLGPVLVQLPPSLPFDANARRFFTELRRQFAGQIVCEPRHRNWFAPAPEQLLAELEIARVAADPIVTPTAGVPGGWNGLRYYRLHGSPRMYYSAYSEDYLSTLAQRLLEVMRTAPVWCIFDNTAEGAATVNALTLAQRMASDWPSPS